MDAPKTVLLGWELGGGFGHVNPMIHLATALASEGNRIVFALRDPIGPWSALSPIAWPILIAPNYLNPSVGASTPTCTMADILGLHGYNAVQTLAPLVRAWDGILAIVKPDLIIADYAPTLTLTASGRIPVIGIGSGFTQPPTHLPTFPKLDEDQSPSFDEADLLHVVNTVQAAHGGPEFETFPQAFQPSAQCLTVYPELDPYRSSRLEIAVGPIETLPPLSPMPSEPRFFAYLVSGIMSTEPGLTALAQAGLKGEAYIRGADEALKSRLRAVGLHIHDTPPPLNQALASSNALIHQGGLQTTMAALAAGRPQMLLPTHLEHLLNAVNVHALGAAHYLSAEYPLTDLVEGMQQLLHDASFHRCAMALAAHYHAAGLTAGLSAVVSACRRWLVDRT